MITSLLATVGAFLFAILVLVTVHEWGHFWVARRLGVRVERFSVGFGQALLRWHRRGDPTEYVIAAIPLGGYVKMVDEREGEVPAEDRPFAFNRQRLWKRSAIVLAGPLANFLFAILLYWGILVAGEEGIRPEVGTVTPDSVAAVGGFEPGDLIKRVGERDTPAWNAVWMATLLGAVDGEDLVYLIERPSGVLLERVIDGDALAALDPSRDFLNQVGLVSARPVVPAVIGELVPGDPAERAGIQLGDRVLSVDDQPIETWSALVEAIQAHPDETVLLGIERDGALLDISLTPKATASDDRVIGRIGAGTEIPDDLFDAYRVEISYGVVGALGEAVGRVLDTSYLTLRIIGSMLAGHASAESISSPIGIADTAGKTASFGVEPFLKFLALLSISLGLLNLLPIPVLDGGHLLFFLVEAVRGKPLSEEVQEQGVRVGIALLIALMSMAFYNDIVRLLG
jgi:regulator of sigma E protease